MLPAIAALHPRHGRHRESGTILATIAGTATVTVGLGGSVNADLRPAAIFVLGVWWWTIGKMWAETEVLPRAFGLATAALGAIALASVATLLAADTLLDPRAPDAIVWTAEQVLLGAWLGGLAISLARAADVPSA